MDLFFALVIGFLYFLKNLGFVGQVHPFVSSQSICYSISVMYSLADQRYLCGEKVYNLISGTHLRKFTRTSKQARKTREFPICLRKHLRCPCVHHSGKYPWVTFSSLQMSLTRQTLQLKQIMQTLRAFAAFVNCSACNMFANVVRR